MRMVLVDSCLFSQPDLEWHNEIRNECQSIGVDLMTGSIPEKSHIHQNEIVSIIGAGCAIAALVLNVLKMIKDEKEKWTYKKLLEECQSYLALRGITDYTIEYETGFQNLLENNGEPCIVKIRSKERQQTIYLNIGKTTEMLIVTPKTYDHRSLPP